ncbi:TIGR03619 family F420-dependent LLM class oxidoreductase [Streptomyces sp. IBSBF 2435]|uniref:TIGR03619 family F420-dependent LLM class oxidoreductase n=1 Tax=Streptomyces sp. IBSBF 2435 TaxID=2903531 RepID=UPI002FDC5286
MTMRVGFALPYLNHVAHEVSRTAEFAREAEKAGAASLWVGDRNFAAVNPKVGAGGFGSTIPVEYRTAADPFVVLGVAAAATERVKLGSHVLIAPVYPPAQLARSLTTIDLISKGRLLPGFGIGWSPEEFEGANLDFRRRGARMDELLDALELLWTQDPVEYHGKHIELPLQYAPLKPVHKPRPPIYIGGLAGAALKRVGERADGWLPAFAVPDFVDVETVLAQRAQIDAYATEAGRDPADIDTIMRINPSPGVPFQQTADVIKRTAERTGIDHFMVEYMSLPDVDASLQTVTEILALIERG